MEAASSTKRPFEKGVRIAFLNEIRKARVQAQQNAEDFAGLLFAFERLAMFVGVDDNGEGVGEKKGLGGYRSDLGNLARFSSVGESLLPATKKWHSSFDTLFSLVTDARNSALHEGAKARHLTEHAIELALILEEALVTMPDPFHKVGDLMVRSIILAYEWQPMSFVRQAMLVNSFTFLPLFFDGRWRLISDQFVATYQLSGDAQQKKQRMAKSVQKAVQEMEASVPLIDAPLIGSEASIKDLLDPAPLPEMLLGKPLTEDERQDPFWNGDIDRTVPMLRLGIPVLVIDTERVGQLVRNGQKSRFDLKDALLGIVTPFDLL